MPNKLLNTVCFLLLIFVAVCSINLPKARGATDAPDPLYNEPGFNTWRETYASASFEHIDPFSGAMILSHEDLRLPGNGGLDLVVYRNYVSKSACPTYTLSTVSYCRDLGDETWVASGWEVHFGKLMLSTSTPLYPHTIIMADGSSHQAFQKNENPNVFITKERWLLDFNGEKPVLKMSNGTRIEYGQHGPTVSGNSFTNTLYASLIEDVHGNTISIHYANANTSVIASVIDSVGREITFNVQTIPSGGLDGIIRLKSIVGPGINIHYEYTTVQVDQLKRVTFLSTVAPCQWYEYGDTCEPWRYGYDYGMNELNSVITPFGGAISYEYGFVVTYEENDIKRESRNIIKKTVGDSPNLYEYPYLPEGTWTFDYCQLDDDGKPTITRVVDPCNRVTNYSFYTYYMKLASGSLWKYGLPRWKEVVGEEKVSYEWAIPEQISSIKYVLPGIPGLDANVYAPVLTKKTVLRDGKEYITAYSNYDGYGNPMLITEMGDVQKIRELTYWRNGSLNITYNKIETENTYSSDARFPGSINVTNLYYADGSLREVNRNGVLTKYDYYDNGNIRTVTDANNNAVAYEWTNGRVSKETNAIYSTSREINKNGTVASKTDGRNNTTRYIYDSTLRLKQITPQIGNPTTFTYSSSLPYNNVRVAGIRGNYQIIHYYDGLGREIKTQHMNGVVNENRYAACNMMDCTTSNVGDTIFYDYLGRTRRIEHKDGNAIIYAYQNGSNVSVTDEDNVFSNYIYYAYGDPDTKLLMAVRDGDANRTSYAYDISGNLMSATQGGVARTYLYDASGFLTEEYDPEKGKTRYTRDKVGNILTSQIETSTVVTCYTYDKLYRVRKVVYQDIREIWPPLREVVNFIYDNADNLTYVGNAVDLRPTDSSWPC